MALKLYCNHQIPCIFYPSMLGIGHIYRLGGCGGLIEYLHQCLFYARLLQLHMDLDYLPHILIVPISSITGKDIYPALFWDYPEECKQAIESFKWSLTPPKPTMDVRGQRPFLTEGHVDRSLPLRYFLDMDVSAGELLDALELDSLELEII